MDWIISDELGLTVGHIVGWGAATAMIIGGVAPYIPQYKQIKRTQDAEGFSLYVCLTLLIANTLRILFWFGKRYEIPLLIQSIVMNATMFAMIHLCVTVRKKNQIIRARERIFTGAIFMLYILLCCVNGSAQPDENAQWLGQRSGIVGGEKPHRFYDMDRKYFWAWTDFQSYVDCMLVFSVFGAAITYLLIEFSPFVELIGFLAVFTEAMLGAPQIAKNLTNKSTEGMSLSMVIMWTCGDLFKTAYFVIREAPVQFWMCGSLQVLLDIVILIQVWLYRNNTAAARRVRRGD